MPHRTEPPQTIPALLRQTAARFEPTLLSETIERVGATIFLGVSSLYHLLLRLGDERVAQWRSIRFCVSGGAAMPVELMRPRRTARRDPGGPSGAGPRRAAGTLGIAGLVPGTPGAPRDTPQAGAAEGPAEKRRRQGPET
jgi:hypothetical protein